MEHNFCCYITASSVVALPDTKTFWWREKLYFVWNACKKEHPTWVLYARLYKGQFTLRQICYCSKRPLSAENVLRGHTYLSCRGISAKIAPTQDDLALAGASDSKEMRNLPSNAQFGRLMMLCTVLNCILWAILLCYIYVIRYGSDTTPIWLTSPQCNGTERTLLECPASSGFVIGDETYCDHDEDIHVECDGTSLWKQIWILYFCCIMDLNLSVFFLQDYYIYSQWSSIFPLKFTRTRRHVLQV